MLKKVIVLTLFVMMFTALPAYAQGYDGCVIPESGPWPDCATGDNATPTPTPDWGENGDGECVIPPSGPWPECARGGGGNGTPTPTPDWGGNGGGECVIPPSGPWPECARGGGGNATPTPTPDWGGNGGGECVIPPSGPWPECARGGGGNPTPTPSPTWTPQQPQVREFTVGTTQMAWGDTTVIHWAVDNVDKLWLSAHSPTGNGFTRRMPATGWHDLTADGLCFTGEIEIILSTTPEFEQTSLAQRELRVTGTEWFWESWQLTPLQDVGCSPAQSVQLAHQQFEHGEMLWIPDPDGNGRLNEILVLFDEPQSNGRNWLRFRDNYNHGDPEPTGYAPPPGLFQPVHGFGKIWHEQSWVRQSLGWATAQEQGYQGLMQSTGTVDWDNRISVDETYISSVDSNRVYQLQERRVDQNVTTQWTSAPATIQ